MGLARMWPGGAPSEPSKARLFDSVAPLVKTTSSAKAPSRAAISSRASSRALASLAAGLVALAGLP